MTTNFEKIILTINSWAQEEGVRISLAGGISLANRLINGDCHVANNDGVLMHTGLQMPVEVAEHVRDGKKIKAIKAYRAYSGFGLRESKAFIDNNVDNILTWYGLPTKEVV